MLRHGAVLSLVSLPKTTPLPRAEHCPDGRLARNGGADFGSEAVTIWTQTKMRQVFSAVNDVLRGLQHPTADPLPGFPEETCGFRAA
jgi:hypothetical protein